MNKNKKKVLMAAIPAAISLLILVFGPGRASLAELMITLSGSDSIESDQEAEFTVHLDPRDDQRASALMIIEFPTQGLISLGGQADFGQLTCGTRIGECQWESEEKGETTLAFQVKYRFAWPERLILARIIVPGMGTFQDSFPFAVRGPEPPPTPTPSPTPQPALSWEAPAEVIANEMAEFSLSVGERDRGGHAIYTFFPEEGLSSLELEIPSGSYSCQTTWCVWRTANGEQSQITATVKYVIPWDKRTLVARCESTEAHHEFVVIEAPVAWRLYTPLALRH